MIEDEENTGEASVTIDGVVYTGKWERAGNMLTVHLPGYGTKSNQLGGLSPDWLARDLIRALVQKAA